jgi:hypothetical protein
MLAHDIYHTWGCNDNLGHGAVFFSVERSYILHALGPSLYNPYHVHILKEKSKVFNENRQEYSINAYHLYTLRRKLSYGKNMPGCGLSYESLYITAYFFRRGRWA